MENFRRRMQHLSLYCLIVVLLIAANAEGCAQKEVMNNIIESDQNIEPKLESFEKEVKLLLRNIEDIKLTEGVEKQLKVLKKKLDLLGGKLSNIKNGNLQSMRPKAHLDKLTNELKPIKTDINDIKKLNWLKVGLVKSMNGVEKLEKKLDILPVKEAPTEPLTKINDRVKRLDEQLEKMGQILNELLTRGGNQNTEQLKEFAKFLMALEEGILQLNNKINIMSSKLLTIDDKIKSLEELKRSIAEGGYKGGIDMEEFMKLKKTVKRLAAEVDFDDDPTKSFDERMRIQGKAETAIRDKFDILNIQEGRNKPPTGTPASLKKATEEAKKKLLEVLFENFSPEDRKILEEANSENSTIIDKIESMIREPEPSLKLMQLLEEVAEIYEYKENKVKILEEGLIITIRAVEKQKEKRDIKIQEAVKLEQNVKIVIGELKNLRGAFEKIRLLTIANKLGAGLLFMKLKNDIRKAKDVKDLDDCIDSLNQVIVKNGKDGETEKQNKIIKKKENSLIIRKDELKPLRIYMARALHITKFTRDYSREKEYEYSLSNWERKKRSIEEERKELAEKYKKILENIERLKREEATTKTGT